MDGLQAEHMLKKAGYVYNYEREMYLNRNARKAFSINFIEEKPENEIVRALNETATSAGWRFYFTTGAPSPSMQQELEKVLR